MINKKVSIIVPVYNVEKFLKECINSIIKQSYNNLEILIIDDGSTDSSGKICDEYLKKDFRIKVIHQENQGLSGARNTGLKYSTGDYITFIDSDDFIDKNMIKEMLNNLIETNSDIVVCGTIFCNEEGEYLYEKVSKDKIIYKNEYQIKELVNGINIPVMSWGKLFKKEILNNFEFPLKKYHEDVFTTYKLLDKANKTNVLDKSYYYYRQVQGSIMNSSFNIKHLDGIEAVLERNKFLENKYPQYKQYDYANLVYICCKVYEKMILANYKDKNIEKKIQKIIRKNICSFLLEGKSKMVTKLFSIICFLNMDLCRNLYLIKEVKNEKK